MASGKQLSFQYGEVSPSLRFRSDAVSYASGLAKLTNMYVRRAGGVSNRQGLEFVKLATSQENVPAPGTPAGIKGFTYWSNFQNNWVTLEHLKVLGSNYRVFMNGTDLSGIYDQGIEDSNPAKTTFTVLKNQILMCPPVTQSAGLNYGTRKANAYIQDGIIETGSIVNPTIGYLFGGKKLESDVFTQNVFASSTTEAPYLPVTYLVTAAMKDGQELLAFSFCSVGYVRNSTDGTGPWIPHAKLDNEISFLFLDPKLMVEHVNLYRASGALQGVTLANVLKLGDNVEESYYSLAARIKPYVIKVSFKGDLTAGSNVISNTTHNFSGSPLYKYSGAGILSNSSSIATSATTVSLNNNSTVTAVGVDFLAYYSAHTYKVTDFGTSDTSITPPLDDSMFLEEAGDVKGLSEATSAAFYQQRLFCAMKGAGTKYSGIDIGGGRWPAGTIIASKIGVPEQLRSPLFSRSTEAFQFNIPITDGTPCVALLAMERLMAFTEGGVWVIRGGEQGIITPTTINPLQVSEEGCSSTIEPKMSGSKGYYVNRDHTKLMAIEFGLDATVEIKEAAGFSEHIFYGGISQMETINGETLSVYLLSRGGKLIRTTVNSEGVHGFSFVETDGYIESIYRGKAKRPYAPNSVDTANSEKYYDVLMCYVIRNGFRTLERLNYREDRYREGEFFADCYKSFGMRISEFGIKGYTKIGAPDDINPRINIGPSAVWTAGTVIPIWCSNPNLYLGSLDTGGILHFFYEDETGKTQFLRYHKQPLSQFSTGNVDYSQGFLGYFDSDVPPYLQDALAQGLLGLSQLEINKRQTRWAPAINTVDLSYSGPHYAGFKDPLSTVPAQAAVTVSADGEVLSSPNNPYAPTLYMQRVEESGNPKVTLTLPDYYTFGYVGMPYTSEFETLDLETGGEKTLTDAKKLLNAVGVGFNESRGGFFGMPNQDLTNMEEIQPREDEDFSNQSGNTSGHLVVNVPAGWNEAGRVNIKQVDPAPITILSVYPKGISGD